MLPSDTMRRWAAPIVFLPLELPFAAAVGYLQIAWPFWLAGAGVSLQDIAVLSGTAFLPHALKVLWVPLIDLTGRPTRWYVSSALLAVAGIMAAACLPDPVHNLPLLTVCITLAQVGAATSGAALNALMATAVHSSCQARAGGFQMAGNVGGTALLGTLPLLLEDSLGARGAGLLLAFLALTMVTFAWLLPVESSEVVGHRIATRLLAIWRSLWDAARSRVGWTGLLICAAPVGCGALTNLFSAMAPQFGADARVVQNVNGLWGAVVSAAGALVGGYVVERYPRRWAYIASGGVTALCALGLACGPLTPGAYTVGALVYMFTNGISFAAFAGMVLEMIGGGAAVATRYALYVAVSNQAISYVTWIDGAAESFQWNGIPLGVRGVCLADAAVALIGMLVLWATSGVWRPTPTVSLASPDGSTHLDSGLSG